MSGVARNTKPLTSITNYTTKFISTPIYKYTKDNKKVLRHGAPRIIGKLRTKTDSDSLKIDAKIKELEKQSKELAKEDSQGREDIKKKIEDLENKKKRLFDNVVEIDKFDFIKDFENSEGVIDRINDPELRGLINILSDKKSNETSIKKIVDNFRFKQNKFKFDDYPKLFKEVLDNYEKYQVKIFNNTFTHPDMEKDGKKIPKKIGGKEGEFMKSYVKRNYKYFDEILKSIVEGKEDLIMKDVLKKFSKEIGFKLNKTNAEKIQNNYDKKLSKEELKEFTKEEIKVMNVLKSTKSLIEELKTYEKLKEEYKSYTKNIEIYEKAKKMTISASSPEEFIKSIVEILIELKPIKLNEIVLNTFIKRSDIKLSKTFKKKLVGCIENEKEIEIIEDEYEEKTDKKGKKKQVKKAKILDETQFYKSEFEIFETPKEELYDINKYAKFGNIVKCENKTIRTAIGLRLVSELKKTIIEKQLNGINSIVIMC